MVKVIILIGILWTVLGNEVRAQRDSTQLARKKHQSTMNQGISHAKLSPPQPDQARKEDLVKVEIDQIPDVLRQTLELEDRYLGWQYATFYLDRNTQQYILQLTEENSTRTYVFDESGKDITATKRPTKSKIKKPSDR